MSDETTISLEDGYPPLEALTTMVPPADATGFSQSLLTFAAVMTFLIMIVGICGNLLTVVALLKCPKVRNVAAAFIISLCIADLLFCALVLPFQGLRFVQGTWRHGQVLCRLIPFIQYGNIGVSLLCIAMITINRYVMITHHGLYARIYKRHWIAVMIAACWLFSYGMQLPTLLGEWGRFGYDSRLQTCSIMTDDHGHSSKTTLFITAFVIPCLVIIACYAKIFWVVHKSEQRLKRHATKQNSIPNNLRPLASTGSGALPSGAECQPSNRVSSDSSSSFSIDVPETAPSGKQQPTRVKDQREVRAKRNEWRITKMVLAIFLSFVVCYLPITIVKVADKNVEHPSLHICSYILLYLSACINPIIYVIMNKQYRKAYKTVVFCQPARLLLPFGKTNGASSAAEMERYRVEQQPQPHNRLPDVGGNGSRIGSRDGNGNGSGGGDADPTGGPTSPSLGDGVAGTGPNKQIEPPAADRYASATLGPHGDTQRKQQQQPHPATAAQEEQSLLHQQRLQQQHSQPQQRLGDRDQQQLHLPARSWLTGERLRLDPSHNNGGGRHNTGGRGAAAHASGDFCADNAGTSPTLIPTASAVHGLINNNNQRRSSGSGEQCTKAGDANAPHLHECRQPEEKPILHGS